MLLKEKLFSGLQAVVHLMKKFINALLPGSFARPEGLRITSIRGFRESTGEQSTSEIESAYMEVSYRRTRYNEAS